jgi:hypothetical protein
MLVKLLAFSVSLQLYEKLTRVMQENHTLYTNPKKGEINDSDNHEIRWLGVHYNAVRPKKNGPPECSS